MSLVTGNNSIDSLVYSSWAAQVRTPVALSYSFMAQAPSNASADDANGFRAMSTSQQQAARDAMAQWATVANITFTEVAANGDIQLGTNDQGDTSSGYAYLPNGADPTYLFTNNHDRFNSTFTPGSYGPTVLLHELGHTLGLKHPGNYDSTGSDIDGPFLPASTDNGDYTVMSYTAPTSYESSGNYNITPMLYDIQAMQYLYGANMSYHTGNDRYTFVDNAPPQCIWDAGGTDVLDFSACFGSTVIDLNAGGFSSTVLGYRNVTIAYGVTIEQAVASMGGSGIICNDAGDLITGGAGNDSITEGGGSDTINAGGGSDTVIFLHSLASYTLIRSGSALTVSGDGTDTLTGVERLQFSDGSYLVSDIPLLNKAIADQAAQVGHAFTLSLDSATFANDNGTAPVLSAKLASGAALPAWLSFDAHTGTFSGTAGLADAGALTVRVSASNGQAVSVADDFNLVVSGSGTVVQGGAGNDALFAGPGDDMVDGGGGTDILHYAGLRSNYTVAVAGGIHTVTDTVGTGGVDTLSGVERIEFSNAGLALDTAGEAGQLYRLYGAMFNRLPDDLGMGFWLVRMDNGQSLVSVAKGFINSPEFVRTYGETASNELFVTSLYNNVLHRAPEQAGFDFQLAALNRGVSREQLLVNFSESPENIASLVGVMPDAVTYTPWVG
jgi:hypothetical protein